MYPTTFEHITLTSGHCSVCGPMHADTSAVKRLAEQISRDCKPSATFPLPEFGPNHSLLVTKDGSCLLGTVYLTECDMRIPVVTIAVCPNPELGKPLWTALHGDSLLPVATSGGTPPLKPWLGARLELGLVFAKPDVVSRLARLEANLAWAFAQVCNCEAGVAA